MNSYLVLAVLLQTIFHPVHLSEVFNYDGSNDVIPVDNITTLADEIPDNVTHIYIRRFSVKLRKYSFEHLALY